MMSNFLLLDAGGIMGLVQSLMPVPPMALSAIFLVVGLIMLTYGADVFVAGASSLAKKMNVSELAIGLTVVAFGTSAPELVVNVFAAVDGNNGIAYGNIVGSNIFNLMFILGVAGLLMPLTAHKNLIWKDTPYSLIAAVVLFVLSLFIYDVAYTCPAEVVAKNPAACVPAEGGFAQGLSRIDALVLLAFFGYFLYYVFKNQGDDESEGVEIFSGAKTTFFTLGGLTLLVLGGKMIVEGAVTIAQEAGMTEELIGLTIVAAGTSLPELATSSIAAYRGKSDIAIANVIGSNIFNIFFILGASAMISPVAYNPKMNGDFYTLFAFTIIFFLFIFRSGVFKRWHAGFFLLSYIVYTLYLIDREGVMDIFPFI